VSIINLKEKTINAKIVYYGTALGGKTTSLMHVHRVIDPEQKIELVSLNTDKDRTLFFDFLPISVGRIGDFSVKLQSFTVPGQVKYNLTRKYVLTGADAVVLVIDSQPSQLEHNLMALENLKENLAGNGLDYPTIPLVYQYNKRDLPDLVPVEELQEQLNERNIPFFETVATQGTGVFEAFVEISKRMLDHIAGQYRIDSDNRSFGDVLERNLMRMLHRTHSGRFPDMKPEDTHASQVSVHLMQPSDDEPEAPQRGLVQVGEEDPELPFDEELLKKAVDSNIEIARLYSEVNETKNRLRDRVRELAALNEVGQTMASLTDVDLLLQTVVDSATSCLGTEFGSLMLLNRSGDGLIEKVVNGYLRDPLARTASGAAGQPMLFQLALKGEPLLVNEDEEPEILLRVREQDAQVRSLMVAPLTLKETVVGVIALYFVTGEAEGSREKLRFLSALASHAAIALENARLVSRIEGFNRELEQKVKERTAALRQAYDDLKQIDHLKDDFLSSMSHELLTPLTSIQSFSEILLDMEGGRTGESGEFLGIINKEALRLTGRLKDLLDLSQIETGKVAFDRQPANLRDVLQGLFKAMGEDFRDKRIQAVIQCPPNLPEVPCDRKWLARALASLLSNAVKFSDEGGEVLIEFHREHDEVLISVSDAGCGIAPEFQTQIFERFRQIGDLLTEKPTGIGLGLPLAREIVEGHHGRIWVESEPGQGSRFTIALPVGAAMAAVAR